MELKGYVTHIRFRNDENGYTVFDIEEADGDDNTCVGYFPFISEGDFLRLTGEETYHSIYNLQFKVTDYEITDPDNETAILRYLSSGAVKGIRGGLAARIVDRFHERTFEVMEKRPEELALVKGISEKKAREIAENFSEQRGMRRAIIFLQKYGIPNTLAIRIYKYYGDEVYEVVDKTPYRLAEDISGVGFKRADEIARKAGFDINSPGRVRAGLLYLLGQCSGEGHTYLPEEELLKIAITQLEVGAELILDTIAVMVMDKVIIMVKSPSADGGEEKRIYLPALYYAELDCARMLHDLDIEFRGDEEVQLKQILKMEQREGIELDDNQREAVKVGLKHGVTVITGGPGTGKTTTINTLIRVLLSENYHILLAAPTGRAAKRMSEATDYPSQTIHRLLEYSGGIAEGENGSEAVGRFGRDRENPLETDVVIVDEMSMVDIYLFHSLLKAIPVQTRLVLVGDENQLPSVGPGNVLKDIIASEQFHVVRLEKIFRQAMESDIVMNAHRILAGKSIDLKKNSGDFFFVSCETPQDVMKMMLYSIVKSEMAKYFDCKPYDIQVLSPMKKGETGVINCNMLLQKHLNPPAPGKNEIKAHDTVFREGDKVMQIKNNYKKEYRILGYHGVVIEEGTGIFNGDIGVIESIDLGLKEVTVCFDDEKRVVYSTADLIELEIAYAVTVHKSQGSEYPAVILPIFGGPRQLMTRNILYTAITRGVKCVMIIGSEIEVERMIANEIEHKRYSSLRERLCQ